MKKYYALLTLIILSTTVSAQITNSGFENWEDLFLFENPMDWKTSDEDNFFGVHTATKSNDAFDGNHSVLLESVDAFNSNFSGYVYHGSIGQSGPDGGIPYTDNFEAMSIQYKTDLNPGDSLYFIMIRFDQGTAVDYTSQPIAYGQNNTWTQQIIYLGNTPQDELFFGFMLTEPGSSATPTAGSWALIDDVKLLSGGVETSPLPNHSFETWEDETVESPEEWYTLNELLAGNGLANVTKTTDAFSGTYAVEMTTITDGNDTTPSYLSKGVLDVTATNFIGFVPFASQPSMLSFAYKYAPVGNDEAEVNAVFTLNGMAIGVAQEVLNASSEYTVVNSYFSLPVAPDSMILYATSGEQAGSVLKLDDIQFDAGYIGLNELSDTEVQLYPNPASSKVILTLPEHKEYTVRIKSTEGRVIQHFTTKNQTETINIQTFESGVYFIEINDGITRFSKKLIVD